MAEEVRQLEGFYYDKEKKKYFKVLPHHATPTSSAYSARNVKRRRYEDEKEKFAIREKARQVGRIKRSTILNDPLLGGLFSRGYGETHKFDGSLLFAHGLRRQGAFEVERDIFSENPIFTAVPRPDVGPNLVDYTTVYRGDCITSRAKTRGRERKYTRDKFPSSRSDFPPRYELRDEVDMLPDHRSASSICANAANLYYACVWNVSDGDFVTVCPMNHFQGDQQLPGRHIRLLPVNIDESIWTAIAGPSTSDTLFAFGSSDGITIVDKLLNFTRIGPDPNTDIHQSPLDLLDVFALDFLKDNSSILLAGGRDGLLKIIDRRVSRSDSVGNHIQTPSMVTHVKSLDSHRVLVAGLNSCMHQYDLRFRKIRVPPPLSPHSSPFNPLSRPVTNCESTLPTVVYADYHNQSNIQTGLDVDIETGVIAAAQDTSLGNDCVQLFSLHGGHKLQSRIGETYNHLFRDSEVTKDVKFVADDSTSLKSIWFMGTELYRVACAPEGSRGAFRV